MKPSTSFKANPYTTKHFALFIILIILIVIEMIGTTQSHPVAPQTTNHRFTDQFSEPNDNHYDRKVNPYMEVRKLSQSGNNVTCNDGSPIGYYMRLNNLSKSWIIYLQGGGFCGSAESCQQRWQRSPHLMSSNAWPKIKSVEGILSSDPKDNPYLWNANHIYVPYCSSDSWTGFEAADQQWNEYNPTSFTFMGSKILEQVLQSLYEDLPRGSSLYEAKFILLAGDSAGATGVILNLDKVKGIIEQRSNSILKNCHTNGEPNECLLKQPPVLRGLADSGWFLDNEPYGFKESETSREQEATEGDCDQFKCTPLQSIKQAMQLWNGQVPSACASRHPAEPWRCYFGYRAYQTLTTPLFVVQWLYDEAQLMVDHIARPDTTGQWKYVDKVVSEMRASLENVTALFAPSCFSHSLVIRRSWNQININGFKLPHVLNSWEEQSLLDTDQPPVVPSRPPKSDESSRIIIESPQKSNLSGTNSNNRSRSRKRRRNNQQQKSKQTTRSRPCSQVEGNSAIAESQSKESQSNDLTPSANPLRDLLPLIDLSLARANLFNRNGAEPTGNVNGRLGRSTLVDDATLMLSNNNMPDDNSANQMPTSTSEQRSDSRWTWPGTDLRTHSLNYDKSQILLHPVHNKNTISDQFRFIDTCGWPQCNRDCPVPESDFNTGGVVIL